MKTHLVKWDEAHRKQGLAIIDVDDGETDSMDEVKDSVEKAKIKYPVAWDEGAKTIKAYDIRSFAHSILIGVDGKVLWEGFPLEDDKLGEREALFKEELKKVTDETKKKIEEETKAK